MHQNVVETITYTIFMAGDINVAKQACREHCFKQGLCVTIEPCDYIYTGGEEAGFRIGLINYPRFPKTDEEIKEHAFTLARLVANACWQHSFTIMSKEDTWWYSSRPQS